MRCREVKLWDRRALNSSIGSQSLSTSSGWVLQPQLSEVMAQTTMRISVWQWEDGRSRKKRMFFVCGMWTLTYGRWHEVRNSQSIRFPSFFLVDLAEVWHCTSTFQGQRHLFSLCPEKEMSVSELSVSHVHNRCKGQAAVNTSAHLSSVLLLVVLCSWPFLLSLFFQTRLPKGQWKAETRLSQERWGIEGWKWNKDGSSEFSFRSLHILIPCMTQAQPWAQMLDDSAQCGEYNYFYFIIFISEYCRGRHFCVLLTLT